MDRRDDDGGNRLMDFCWGAIIILAFLIISLGL
jgi:hypothetical protein